MASIESLEKRIAKLEERVGATLMSAEEVQALSTRDQLVAYAHGKCSYMELSQAAINAGWYWQQLERKGVTLGQEHIEAGIQYGEAQQHVH